MDSQKSDMTERLNMRACAWWGHRQWNQVCFFRTGGLAVLVMVKLSQEPSYKPVNGVGNLEWCLAADTQNPVLTQAWKAVGDPQSFQQGLTTLRCHRLQAGLTHSPSGKGPQDQPGLL